MLTILQEIGTVLALAMLGLNIAVTIYVELDRRKHDRQNLALSEQSEPEGGFDSEQRGTEGVGEPRDEGMGPTSNVGQRSVSERHMALLRKFGLQTSAEALGVQ